MLYVSRISIYYILIYQYIYMYINVYKFYGRAQKIVYVTNYIFLMNASDILCIYIHIHIENVLCLYVLLILIIIFVQRFCSVQI